MITSRKITEDEYTEATGLENYWFSEECRPTVFVIERYERLGSFAMWGAGLVIGVFIGIIFT